MLGIRFFLFFGGVVGLAGGGGGGDCGDVARGEWRAARRYCAPRGVDPRPPPRERYAPRVDPDSVRLPSVACGLAVDWAAADRTAEYC